MSSRRAVGHELVDEGNRRAGQFMVAGAAAAGDLRELQRLSDADCRDADVAMRRLLADPMTT